MKLNRIWRAGLSALFISGEASSMSTKLFLPGATRDRSPRFISRHLTLWLVLLILGVMFVLSSVLAGARTESRKNGARAEQKRSIKSVDGLNAQSRMMLVKREREERAGNPYLLTTGAATLAESSTSEQQSNAQDQTQVIDGASAQVESVPVLTLQNAPDIPQCREILNQEILDLVNAASADPAETFENNRQAHPHTIMMPPPLDCASKLWMAARQKSRAAKPADSTMSSEFLSLRQSPIESFFNLGALKASVGTNIDPVGGVEEYQGTGSISVDPNNPLHLIASSNTFYKDPTSTCQSPTGGTANTYGTIALFGSTDGGATWTYNCAPWPATVTGGVTGATFWFGSYPTLAWDNQGQAYASYLLLSQSASAYGTAIVVARSSDNGASWQNLGTVVNGIASTTQGNDKEMMAIDNTSGQTFSHTGRIYVIWQAANAQKIGFSDNGTAWTTVNFPSNTGSTGGNVVIGADGTVYVIWTRYNVETIVFSKSTNGGATWTAPQVIATLALQSFGNNNKPPAQDKRGVNGFGALDVDRNPASSFFGSLYVAFSDFPAGTTTGADLNTYVVRSTNGGTSWSSRVKANDDNFGATQMFPWLAVDQSDGTVNVSWYDTRLDPLNRQTQSVYARSTDGGASFEPNVLVSDGGTNWKNNINYADENSADNPAFNSNQYGDYSGIAALNRQAHPLWTDSRMFFPVADTQSPTRREDNATATITNCSAPSAIGAPVVNPSTAPSVAVSWSAPAGWGTNATNGTYSVFRDTSPVFPSGSPLASDLTATNYVDTIGNSGTTYYYFIRAKNNCPGTALTPMSADSPASAAVEFGSTGTPTGALQGTVTAGGSPVSGVVVSAGTLSATTNADGFYLFAAIDANTYTVSASPPGYSPASVNGVVVTGGGTSAQNLALMPIASGSCFTETTFADFSTGTGSNADISVSPGDVKLANLGAEVSDQVSSPAALSTTNNLSATTWTGQTFRAGVTGNLKKLSVGLGLASGTSGTITVEIRNLNGVNPGTTVLGSGTFGPVTNVGTAQLYTTTLTSPAAVVSGTSYSIVIRTSVGSTVFGVRGSTAGGSSLANGQVFTTTNSGTSWTGVAADLYFTTFVTPPLTYQTSGNFISSVKDASQVVGLAPRWLTLSWNATTPANTTVQFQAAASDNLNGPFNFVGPDGTALTFFTGNGASLSQFNGFRYLKYKALLSTTNNIVTPVLNDVIVCFDNDTPMITAAAPLFRKQAGDAANAQIATVSDPGQAANQLIVTSTPVTGTGVVINSIIVDAAGRVTADVAAGCAATNSTFTLTVTNGANAAATATLIVNVTAIDTPTIAPGGPTTFCEGGSVMLTSSSASGNQWYLDGNPIGGATNQSYNASSSGDYAVTVNVPGCPINPSAATPVTVNPTPATPTITPDGPTTFCSSGSVTLTSSSTSGNQWYLDGNPIGGATNQAYIVTAAGNYTDIVTANGCASDPSSATAVTVNPTPATPTITPDAPTTFCNGGSVTLTSSGATGNQWYLNGNQIGGATNQAYTATASGNYNVTNTTTTGCTSALSSAITVTVNPTPATPTITPDGPTTFCDSVTLTSSSASGNQWYLNGTPIGGATNQTYNATTSGDYTVVATTGGCSSAPSAPMKVAANTAPELTYQNQTVIFNGSLTINPATGPSDNISVSSISVQSVGTYTGTISVNNTTGAVSISNAAPAGTHTITIRATDACDAFAEASFTLTISKADQTIAFGTLTGKSYGNAPFTVSGTGGASGNPLTFSSTTAAVCSVSGNTVTILAPGTCTIRASQAGDGNYNAASDVDQSFTVTKAASTTTVTVSNATYDGQTHGGTASVTGAGGLNQSLTITYTGRNGTVYSSTTAPTNVGDYTASASFAVDTNHNSSSDSKDFSITKANQTITFGALTDKTYGDAPFTVSATGGASSIAITFSSLTPAVCTVNGDTVTIVSAGTCTIRASQAGNSNYNPAVDVDRSFTVAKAASITTVTVSNATYDGQPHGGTAIVTGAGGLNQNLTITYTGRNGTVYSSTTAPTNAGDYTASVSFAGDANHNGSSDSKDFSIAKANQTITFNALSGKTYGDAPFTLSATGGNSGNAVTFSSTTPTVCTVSGNTVTILSAGTCTIRASQAGNSNYNAATPVDQSFTVAKANQTITFAALANKTFGDPDFTVSATASSGLTVSFAASGQCTVSGNIVHLTGAGSCTITASQAGDANYNGAASIAQSFTISNSSATITLSNLSQTYDGTAKAATVVTTPAGLSYTLSYTQGGNVVASPTSAGSYDVTATINDPNYQGSTTGILVINKATPVITWSNPSNIVFGTPLSSTQLNATADTPGTFTYNPPSGTVLNVGTHQLSVTFTPTDTANYTTASRSVSLTVDPVTAAAFNLDSATYTVNEGDGHVTLTVNRTGSGGGAASVNYTTSDTAALTNCNVFNGIASSRCDYAITVGTLRFAPGEMSKTISIPIVDDSYAEGPENFSIALSNAAGENLGAVSTATITITDNETVTGPNPIDTTDFFVREHYIDFLGREPEPGGFAGWRNILNNCPASGKDANGNYCDRIEVSAGFFRSEEFQSRGYFIYRFYSSVGRIPHYDEFMPDFAKVSGFLSAQQLEANKAAFVTEFMARQEFQNRYGTLSDPTAFVDGLLQTVGLQSHPTRGVWITGLTNGTMTRAQVLRALIESAEVYQKYYTEAFVVMQYFGYLRRDPDILYLKWIETLDQTGDYRTMINGFLNSAEYRQRFGPQ